MSLYKDAVQRVVEADGSRVEYSISDPPAYDGPTVVLLHGAAGDAQSNFGALYPMIAFTRRVVALDFRAPPEADPFTVDTYVAQAVAVIRASCGDEPVALVGHSLGAVVAASLAAAQPSLVASLVLIAGWVRTDRSQQLRISASLALAEAGLPELASFSVYTAFSPDHLRSLTEADFAALIEQAGEAWTDPQLIRATGLCGSVDISVEAARIQAPALVIACTQDLIVHRGHGWELFGAIPDARYAEIDSGHAALRERAIELYFLIDEFVGDPRRAAAGAILTSEAG